MRKTVTVSDEMARLIKKAAMAREVSESDIIRRAISEFMARRGYSINKRRADEGI